MLEKVKQFVRDNFKPASLPHFDRAIFWLKELKPDVDETMLIAAYAHDIGRAVRKEKNEHSKGKKINEPAYLKKHQMDSAEVITEFLEKHNYPEDQIKRIHNMVLHHEEGGIPEWNLIMDVDSISFLEVNVPKFITDFVPITGKERVKEKFEWMYNRISSAKAKKLAKPFYQKAMIDLAKSLRCGKTETS